MRAIFTQSGISLEHMIWTILGLSVGIVAVFCISVAELLVGNPFFEPYRPHAAIGLAVLGGIAWLTGRGVSSRRSADAGRGFILFDLRYWGPMLVVLGVITLFIRPLRWTPAVKEVQVAKRVVKEIVPPAPQKEEALMVAAPVPVIFPDLKIQGLIMSQDRPVVILNGHPYSVGDQLGEVVVKAIDRTSVMLEMQGAVKVLTLN